jgi:hypothetical protein
MMQHGNFKYSFTVLWQNCNINLNFHQRVNTDQYQMLAFSSTLKYIQSLSALEYDAKVLASFSWKRRLMQIVIFLNIICFAQNDRRNSMCSFYCLDLKRNLGKGNKKLTECVHLYFCRAWDALDREQSAAGPSTRTTATSQRARTLCECWGGPALDSGVWTFSSTMHRHIKVNHNEFMVFAPARRQKREKKKSESGRGRGGGRAPLSA